MRETVSMMLLWGRTELILVYNFVDESTSILVAELLGVGLCGNDVVLESLEVALDVGKVDIRGERILLLVVDGRVCLYTFKNGGVDSHGAKRKRRQGAKRARLAGRGWCEEREKGGTAKKHKPSSRGPLSTHAKQRRRCRIEGMTDRRHRESPAHGTQPSQPCRYSFHVLALPRLAIRPRAEWTPRNPSQNLRSCCPNPGIFCTGYVACARFCQRWQ